MSGYLNSLVRRAAAPELSVRPLIPSRFAPPAPAPRLEPAPLAEDEAVVEAVVERGSHPPVTSDVLRPAARDPAVSETRVEGAASPTVRDTKPLRAATSSGPLTRRPSANYTVAPPDERAISGEEPSAIERHRVIDDVEAHAPTPLYALQVSQSLHPREETRRPRGREPHIENVRPAALLVNVETRRLVDSDRDRPDDPDRIASKANVQPESVVRPAARVEPASRRTQSEALLPRSEPHGKREGDWDREDDAVEPPRFAPAERILATRETRLARPAPAPRREELRAERSSAPDPVIHVTIGRIEVRGSTIPEPRAKPRTALAGPSLDYYLRQRSDRGGT